MFVLLVHHKGVIDRDTCNVHVSQIAPHRTAAALPSTPRHGKSEDEYQKSKIVAKDRYRLSGSFHNFLSAYFARCSREECGTTAQETDLNAAMLSPTALPRGHSRQVFLEVRSYMISLLFSVQSDRTQVRSPNTLTIISAISSQSTPQQVNNTLKTCNTRKLSLTTMTVIHIGRYLTLTRLHSHCIRKKREKLTHHQPPQSSSNSAPKSPKPTRTTSQPSSKPSSISSASKTSVSSSGVLQ